ncbi:MAG: DUF5076 domain-containing protein [Gemmataceae bacterium]
MVESLPIPAMALTDPDALEIARIWVAKGGQHVSLAPTTWHDPAAWGEFLVDFITIVADSYVAHGRDRDDAMARILAGFEKQIHQQKEQPSDGYVDL